MSHLSSDLDWTVEAACATNDPDLWFPEANQWQKAQKAREICNTRCPVREQCLTEALRRQEQHGIWAGHNMRELRELRRTA